MQNLQKSIADLALQVINESERKDAMFNLYVKNGMLLDSQKDKFDEFLKDLFQIEEIAFSEVPKVIRESGEVVQTLTFTLNESIVGKNRCRLTSKNLEIPVGYSDTFTFFMRGTSHELALAIVKEIADEAEEKLRVANEAIAKDLEEKRLVADRLDEAKQNFTDALAASLSTGDTTAITELYAKIDTDFDKIGDDSYE